MNIKKVRGQSIVVAATAAAASGYFVGVSSILAEHEHEIIIDLSSVIAQLKQC